jgi:WD40 repeat protein
MTASPPCPRPEDLQRLLLGHLSDAEAEHLEQHLGRCPHCVRAAQTLHPRDTLADTVSAVGRDGAVPPDEIDPALLASLCRLGPPAANGSDEATAAETPSAQLSADTPPPPGPTARGTEKTQDLYDFLAPPQGPGEIGRLGGYRVLKVLGQGGMGVVFLAEDPRLQRPVALKAMRPALAADPAGRERFLREARATAAVKNDHVVTIHQVDEERGVPFLAMEFLDGLPLDRWLQAGRTPSVAQVLRIGREIALGLAAAHARGLVHRDIKPANLWLEASHGGRVKILDFGLARAVSDDVHLTQSGAVVGTPAYMAPEQARGDKVDHRCDLFSLGCVLYRLCAGRNPFRGETTLAVLTALAVDNPPPVHEVNSAIPPALSDLVMGLLDKDPARRPASARAVAEALQAVERSLPGHGPAPVAAVTPDAASRGGRRRLLAVAAGLAAAAALVAGIVVIIRDEHGKEVGRFPVPPGGSAEVKDEKERPGPKEGVRIEPEPLAPLPPGEPLSRYALVRQPARLPGVRSWTIERREAWIPSALAFRPDGKRLAVAGHDGAIRVWEPQTGRLAQVLLGNGLVLALAWSPDGQVLATGSWLRRQSVQLWDAETGRLLRSLATEPDDTFTALAFAPDGRTLLGWAGKKGGCLAWDAAGGKPLRRVPIAFDDAAFSPDAKRVAGPQADNRVSIRDTETGTELAHVAAPAPVWHLAWSPDGKRLAGTGQDGLHVWDAQTAAELFRRKDAVLPGPAPVWSPDGRAVAYLLDGNRGVVLVEAVEGAEPRRLDDPGNTAVAWSPDGHTIARMSGWPWVLLYDAATGKKLRTLSWGTPVLGFAWSPEGPAAALSEYGQTSLWSLDPGRVTAVLKDTTGPVAWSPDGKAVATGGPNNAVLVWEAGGKLRFTLAGHGQDVTSLAWSPDGKRLASAAGEERVLLWDPRQGERAGDLGPFPAPAEALTWSPDGRLLAFNVPDLGWHVWDVGQGKLANDPREWKALRFAFAPDGRSALVAPAGGEPYRLRELTTGKERGRLPVVARSYLGPPAWSPDGRLLAVPTDLPGVELWRGDLARRVWTLRGADWNADQVAFSRDGTVVVAQSGGRVQVWEADTGRQRGLVLLGGGDHGLTITPDGHYAGSDEVERGIVMVVQKEDGTQELLEPADFEQKYGFPNEPGGVHLLQPLPPSLTVPPGQPLGPLALVREPAELPAADATSWTIETRGARAAVRAVAYRPDGKLLATGGDDGTIRLWDPATGDLVRMLVGDPVQSLSWSKDGKVLAAGGASWAAWLWEADTGRLLRRLPGGYNLAWSPDGHTLARLDSSPRLQLWDAVTERVVRSYDFPSTGQALAWSPDGKTLAVGLGDRTARLWDVASARETGKLEGHQGASVRGVAWSPDGKRLVTVAAGEPAFRVWEAATGKLLGRFALAAEPAPVAAWSPDGRAVALGFPPGVHLVDPETGRDVRALDAGDGVLAVAWSPDGKQVATAGEHGVSLHDAATGKRASTPEVIPEPWIWSLAWSPDGRRLGLGSPSGAPVVVVEAATGRRHPVPAEASYAVAWSPDGKLLAARAPGWRGRLWDAVTLQPVRTLDGQVRGPFQPAWSADSKKLAINSSSGLGVWSAETGKLLWQNEKQAIYPAWSPDGRWLATNDRDGQAVCLWEADSGKLVHELPFFAWNLVWSPDSKTLAAGSAQGTDCLLIDAASGAVRIKMEGGLPLWSSDGKTLLTVSWWGLLRARDAATGAQRWAVPISRLPPTTPAPVGWSADGRVLARSNGYEVHLCDADGHQLGVLLLPGEPFAQLAVTADGHYRGSARVEREVRMVVQKRDGASETLTPAEFGRKYDFRNNPAQVRLTPD